MQVSQTSITDFLGAPGARFTIPPYQRAYSWTEDQCFELWLDIKRAARSGTRHFTGTLICAAGIEDSLEIVDGQQRITTMTLLIAALCAHLRETGTNKGELSTQAMTERYLVNGSTPKLTLQRDDAATLGAVIANATGGNTPLPNDPAERITSNLRFFRDAIKATLQDEERPLTLQEVWAGITSLYLIKAQVVDVSQAQRVFESLNSKGRPLNLADLSRNYLLLSESHEEQERLYNEYWSKMEELFAPDPGSLRLNSAIKGWLTVRFRKVRLRSVESVYSGFKQYVEDTYDGTKEDLLREMRGFCLMWAEQYRFHAVKKFKSSYDWAINGAPTLTAGYKLKKAHNEEYAQRVREELKRVDANW